MCNSMNGSDLRISNCNYDASVLLKRVRGLLARDDQLLGGAVQRSALMRLPGPNTQHVMTQIEVLPKFGVRATNFLDLARESV